MKSPVTVDANVMQEWNNYANFLKEKGYAGNPQMNHIDVSNKAFLEYKKAHPETILTPDHIQPIQQEIHKYRDYLINKFKTKDPGYTPPDNMKPDYSNFMSWAGTDLGAKNDGIVGQYTSQFRFPSQYATEIQANKDAETKRLGFANQMVGTNK